MILYLLFFSFVEKRCFYIGLESSLVSFPFDGAISNHLAMTDDKTTNIILLNSDSSGKEFILLALLWKQMLWKPLWCTIVMKMEENEQFQFWFQNQNCDLVIVKQPQRYLMIFCWFFTACFVVVWRCFRIVKKLTI